MEEPLHLTIQTDVFIILALTALICVLVILLSKKIDRADPLARPQGIVLGALWLTLNAILGYLGLPPFATYPIGPEGGLQVPTATVLVLGGVVGGIALSGVSQVISNASANAAARRAKKALESSIGEVARARVLAPAEAVVATHAAARDAVDALL